MSQTDYSKLVLGMIVVMLVVAFPAGIVGSLERLRGLVRRPRVIRLGVPSVGAAE
jgi:branched-chain amino acid transport system permease protein